MRKTIRVFLAFVLVFSLMGLLKASINTEDVKTFLGQGKYLGEYWPTTGWRMCTPEEVGMDSERLMKVYEYAANPAIKTQALLVVRKGYIVGEAYLNGFRQDSRHESFSMAKSFTSALIGIAIEKKFIAGVDEQVSKYFPEWQRPETPNSKKTMTVKHLLTMTSGLVWNEDDYYVDRSQNDVDKMIESGKDWIQYVLKKPVRYKPGKKWYYSSGDTMLLSGIIEKSTTMTAFDFAKIHLFAPLGLDEIIWLSDPSGHTITGWGIRGTGREFAKFGYLYLQNGLWEDVQVVQEGWIQESRQPVSENVTKYGYQWWLRSVLGEDIGPNIPDKILIAWGIYTQQIFVIPGKDLVIVRLGFDRDPNNDEWKEAEFLSRVLDCLH